MVNIHRLLGAVAAALILGVGSTSWAQVAPGQSMTPQQMQGIINMRALQMRGGGQVRTGYPQDIQFGAPQQGFSQVEEQQANQDRKAATQKRIDARKAAEEKKKAAREEAKNKKGKAAAKAKNEQADAKGAKKLPPAKSGKAAKSLDDLKSAKGAQKPVDESAEK